MAHAATECDQIIGQEIQHLSIYDFFLDRVRLLVAQSAVCR